MTTQTESASATDLKTKLPYPLHFLADLAKAIFSHAERPVQMLELVSSGAD